MTGTDDHEVSILKKEEKYMDKKVPGATDKFKGSVSLLVLEARKENPEIEKIVEYSELINSF